MRERLDCFVLQTRCSRDWVAPMLGTHAAGRLNVHGTETDIDIDADAAHTALASMAMSLRRYDVCFLPVAPASLAWARISLSQPLADLQTPIIAVVNELTAAALHDLYQLGIADFLRMPFCSHEARIRVERLLDDQRRYSYMAAGSNPKGGGAVPALQTAGVSEAAAEPIEYDSPDLEAYAIAAASRFASTRESFRESKSKAVACFERAYITAALGRHGGNIAMAARAAQKHRRAFWALMRKHDIDAEPFRNRS